MFRPIRALEYQGSIWRNFGRSRPTTCPDCKSNETRNYIGFAPSYTEGTHAKLYQCSACEAWVDCVWPKWQASEANRTTTTTPVVNV